VQPLPHAAPLPLVYRKNAPAAVGRLSRDLAAVTPSQFDRQRRLGFGKWSRSDRWREALQPAGVAWRGRQPIRGGGHAVPAGRHGRSSLL